MQFAVAIVLCLVSLVHAQTTPRAGGGRPVGFRPKPGALSGLPISTWNRTLDGQDVRESGLANDTASVVIVRSRDVRTLRGLGRDPAETLYDFSGASVVVVVRIGSGCFVIPADASVTIYTAAAAEVNGRNGTTIGAPAGSVQLNATERTPSTASSEAIKRFCRSRPVIDAVALTAGATFPAAGSEPAGQKILSFVTLDTSVQLLASRPRGPASRPGRPGLGGPGGPGRG